jgi:predicted nucleic acid-binding protein
MPEKPEIVISDTSCFIILEKVGELDLLQKVYSEIFTTKEVAKEFGEQLPEWVKIQNVEIKGLEKVILADLDDGEASTIALALKISENVLIILDDLKARKTAKSLGLRVTGTLGVIVKAHKEGVIDNAAEIVKRIQREDFRISQKIIDLILKEIK